jgi:hypothetical protein
VECWSAGVLKGWRDGGMECWSAGVLNGWRDGGMEGWISADDE